MFVVLMGALTYAVGKDKKSFTARPDAVMWEYEEWVIDNPSWSGNEYDIIAADTTQAQILINEVRPADETSDYNSFIELRNAGTRIQSLNGFTIKYTPSNAIQDHGGFLDNLGTTGYYNIPDDVNLGPDEMAVFYFGCSGTSTSKVKYIPDMNKIPLFCNISLYSRNPSTEHHGGEWYGMSLHDFVRFGAGGNPPREVIWDRDSYTGNEWIAKHAAGIIVDIHIKYNQWSGINDFVDTRGLPPDASISYTREDDNTPQSWIFTSATPGESNLTIERVPLLEGPSGPIEKNSLPALELSDNRPILYAASFDHYLQGDYPRDWYYHLMVSNVPNHTYDSPAKITGSFAVNKEYGIRGLWITPSSLTVDNHNMAVAVFGEADWTDYLMTFTVKQTTGDFNRHQLCEFYMRLVDDTNRVEGYQFNLIGGTSISVRNALGTGADIGKVNIHRDVDISGGGQDGYQQLTKDTCQIVNPCNDMLKVALMVQGNKITATYDNQRGGILTMSVTDSEYSSGKVGLGLVYGNYIYNDIIVEDLTSHPTGSVPVAVVNLVSKSVSINTDVNFSAENSIYSGNQSKLTYLWDFGDGLRGTGQRPLHSFSAVGTYRVICTISDGTDQTTDGMFITVFGPDDNTPPSDAANLKATPQGDGITLSWDEASDAESHISGYTIYRGTSASPTAPLITVRNISEFKDVSGAEDTEYFYRVKAVNGIKLVSSNFSNGVSASW